jgi:hypothetical protein
LKILTHLVINFNPHNDPPPPNELSNLSNGTTEVKNISFQELSSQKTISPCMPFQNQF